MTSNDYDRPNMGDAQEPIGYPEQPAMSNHPSTPSRQYVESAYSNSYESVAPVQQISPQESAYVPAVGVAGQYSRNSATYTSRNAKSSRGKKIAIAIVIIALIAGLVGLGFYIYKEMQKQSINEDLHKLSNDEMQAVDNELTGTTTFDAPFTVLLLGSDARSDDPDMGARTDTIILCRVDPLHNIITMMSIPRDTRIEIPGVGPAKFNAAYTYGGPSGTIAAVKNLTGIDIDHYAEINFEGLVDLIDAIGGIDVTVDERIDDPDAGDIVIEAGEQHLNGAAALVFSRSRAYADGDYTRTRNQRRVIDAIIHKGLEAPAGELAGIIQTSTKFLTTDSAMDFDFIYSLANQIRHNNDYPITIYAAGIPSAPTMVGDVSYVIADTAGVAEMARVFKEGGDISTVGTISIDSDIAAAGGGAPSETNTSDGEFGYYYDPNAGAATTYGYDTTYNYGYDTGAAGTDTTYYYDNSTYGYDTGATGTYDAGTAGTATDTTNNANTANTANNANGTDVTYNSSVNGATQ